MVTLKKTNLMRKQTRHHQLVLLVSIVPFIPNDKNIKANFLFGIRFRLV